MRESTSADRLNMPEVVAYLVERGLVCVCDECGRLFRPTHPNQLRCSEECREAANRRLTLKRYHENARADLGVLPFRRTIAERLGMAMDERGETSKSLALKVRTDERSVRLYRRAERTPGLEVFSRMCKALDVSADWLLGLKEER